MNPKLQLALAACALASCAFADAADLKLTVDSLQHCLDTGSMSGGKASMTLPAGRYVVSINDNTLSCADQASGCKIDTVVIESSGNWGLAIKAPTVIDTQGGDVAAFVVDSYCGDNTGSATLRFQRAR